MPLEVWLEPIVVVGIFVLSAIGGLIIWELRKIHARIDKYTSELDAHVRDSVAVKTTIAEMRTEIRLHMQNGLHHRERGERDYDDR